uniref:Proteasome subunit alpha type n=1 Tax=Heterorhabditis bacteriophora TaxID=37862 RepID=A0A1I7WZL4_HETBA
MSSIGTGYDLAASTFSPDGRIFQIEYAQKAVDNSGTMIALKGKNGIVTAVDKVITSKMYEENANPRMFNANEFIGISFAGIYPDCRALKDYACSEAVKYLKSFREPMPIQKLANAVAEYIHIFTLGISRPFGASVFFSAWNKSVRFCDNINDFYCSTIFANIFYLDPKPIYIYIS